MKIEYVATKCDEFELRFPEKRENICFNVDGKEILSISPKGIKLNRENFSEFTPDDFAKEFIKILETNFNVKFILKSDLNQEINSFVIEGSTRLPTSH